MALGGLRNSKALHNELLQGVLRSTSGFFDTTPKGRILNRFAGDVYVVDNVFPNTIRNLIFRLFTVRQT